MNDPIDSHAPGDLRVHSAPARSANEAAASALPSISMNTAFPIHITPHHLTLSPNLSQFVCDKVARLHRFASDALGADVVLRRHHGTVGGKRFSASARLALPGRDLHATATHADLYDAVTGLTRKLARQSRKRETRRVSTSRRRRSPRGTRRVYARG
jgi:putative sigma-54 modulation protein